MYTIKKLHKTYGKRKIQVFDGKKMIGEIQECWGWLAMSRENHDILRKIAIENKIFGGYFIQIILMKIIPN